MNLPNLDNGYAFSEQPLNQVKDLPCTIEAPTSLKELFLLLENPLRVLSLRLSGCRFVHPMQSLLQLKEDASMCFYFSF